MINQQELRIGNLFQFSVKGEIQYWDICDIMTNPFEVYFTQNDQYNYSDNLQPIPLTEELLVKCGFVKLYDGSSEWSINEDFLTFIIEHFEYTNAYHFTGGEGVRFGVGCKYLHQLQNLYFALTGEELTINL